MDLYYTEGALISDILSSRRLPNVTFVKFLNVFVERFFSAIPKGESCLEDAGYLSF